MSYVALNCDRAEILPIRHVTFGSKTDVRATVRRLDFNDDEQPRPISNDILREQFYSTKSYSESKPFTIG